MAVQKCTVPMDFGRHNLEKNGLNDLQLICRGGEIVRASSFPLAMNSLVMSDLVGDQGMKELDVKEFSYSSVLCFVRACYKGTLTVSRSNFRELNKLSAVFKVDWMIEECLKFYTKLCLDLNPDSLDLVVFLFEEAAYIIRKRNDRGLFDALSPMIMGFPTLGFSLIEAFISCDPNQQDYVNTDLFLSMATIKEGAILYEWLIENFELKTHPVKLTDVEIRFLTLPSLTLCFQADPTVYQKLLTVVQQSLSKDDLLSLFETFGSIALSPLASAGSTSISQNSITYPIEIPLGECNSFLDAVKLFNEEPKISSCLQFVSSLYYCCKIFGDISATSPEIIDLITAAMEKRRKSTVHGLLGVPTYSNQYDRKRSIWSSYPNVIGIVDQYLSTQEKVGEKRHHNSFYVTLVLPLQLPFQTSKRQFLNLHYLCSSCPENPVGSYKWCKVAVDISMTIKDYETWPEITIQLVEDQTILKGERNAHFHQDPEFLQYISISQHVDDKEGIDFNFCSDRGTNRDASGNDIYPFYQSLQRNGKIDLYIRWPVTSP
eukprot:sb/3463656/